MKNRWIEFFIADFYSSKLKLIIELDGNIHESRKDDSERDSKLLNISNRISQVTENKQNSPLPLSFKGRGGGKGGRKYKDELY